MGTAACGGKTGRSTRVNGCLAAHLGTEYSLTPRAKSMTASGGTTKRKDSECISIRMGPSTRDYGIKIYNMGEESRDGRMGQCSVASTERARKTEWASISGQTAHVMKASGRTMR